MATRIIDDAKLQNIAVAIQGKDGGGQMTVDEMPGRIEGLPEKLETFLLGNLRYLKTNANYIPIINYVASTQAWLLNMEFMSFNNNIQTVPSDFMRAADFAKHLKYINLGAPTSVGRSILFAQIGVKTIIIKNKNNVITLNNLQSFDPIYRGIGYLYIPDLDINGNNLVQQYHSATNWSACADRIKGFSEAPPYDNATTYEIGDVCKYNGKLYGYCKEDLTSSTGNAPSGTTDDNSYWEYIADIEVI